MKQLIIVGAGGMGRTVYGIAMESIGYGTEFIVKGFVDDNIHALDGFQNYPPIIGTLSDYTPQEDDVFVSSIGADFRQKCIEKIQMHGGRFINIIHSTARVRTNVQMGVGNIVCAYAVIGADCVVGDFNLFQNFSIIGHDVRVGNFNRIDTHVTCVGGITICNNTNIHTSAIINHGVVVEDDAHVGAGSFVIRKVKAGTTVFGNPARRL